jgi:hypothetical protein
MANIFTLENIDDFSEKINLDELYEKKRQYDVNKLELFKKILNRVHVRIKTTSRQKIEERFCWFVVPEVIIGVPKYDQAGCIAYIMDKLQENGFSVKYYHPNTIFISWNHWVPSYVRTELKKKTGIEINEYGVKIEEDTQPFPNNQSIVLTKNINNNKDGNISQKSNQNTNKKYTPIDSYKPSGNLVYNEELLSKIEDKFK